MTSFGWKRKAGGKVCKPAVEKFTSQSKEEGEDDEDIDWLTLQPKRKALSLEDAFSKSDRLKAEGTVLAEAERFWEAIKKWDEALQLTPANQTIWDMKAQALMALGEVFPAVQAAAKTVELAPTWWVAHQTRGRALVSMGEVNMALKSFSHAVHLNPAEKELWSEDLMWTKSLIEQRKKNAELFEKSTATISEIVEPDSLDSQNENSCNRNNIDNELSVVTCPSQRLQDSRSYNSGSSLMSIPRNYVQMRDDT